ncbi:MAG: imidazole glycerol phosphate synthase subunit HisH [Deltaproteobacteria bacterium]|nr:imidazole glycerol phosphate synthase subunit HisH [Deltaproteobacteria bacterium]
MREVVVVRTGVANLASVMAALHREDVRVILSHDRDTVERAGAVILPGVGAFRAGMEALAAHGLGDVLRARVEKDRPTLAICLGLQLLAEESEESPGTRGLAIIPGVVRRFPSEVRVPQLGWTRVEVDPPAPGELGLIEPGFAYYANSYRLLIAPPGWRSARSVHGGPFIAALERGRVLACQFHPELSGAWGRALIARWLTASLGSRSP